MLWLLSVFTQQRFSDGLSVAFLCPCRCGSFPTIQLMGIVTGESDSLFPLGAIKCSFRISKRRHWKWQKKITMISATTIFWKHVRCEFFFLLLLLLRSPRLARLPEARVERVMPQCVHCALPTLSDKVRPQFCFTPWNGKWEVMQPTCAGGCKQWRYIKSCGGSRHGQKRQAVLSNILNVSL